MPTAKAKGGPASHRYRPASEYDDATLAQKRAYWRTKKREQRARLSQRTRKPHDGLGEKLRHVAGPAAANPTGSCAVASLQTEDELHRAAGVPLASPSSQDGVLEEKRVQAASVRVSPQSPATSSANAVAVKCLTARGRHVTSATTGGSRTNAGASAPAVRASRLTNGSSANAPPQPRVSMQGPAFPKAQRKAQHATCVPPTGVILEDTAPPSGTNSALVADEAQPALESEEEKAARRREQWRVKKREQRAKMAARLAKARERTQGAEPVGNAGPQHLSSHAVVRGTSQKPFPARVRTLFTSAKRESDKMASLATVDLHANPVRVQRAQDATPVKKPGDTHRKLLLGHAHVARGIARCKTPRQRFMEAQKMFTLQRNLRCKSPLYSGLGTRNIPRIDPNDTPEQVIAKRREYWRVKKREQRAKLSMEVKTRLKEKDSLTRRVKRYQRILEDMRRARALAQAAAAGGGGLIGGFIGEDGTVSADVPPHKALRLATVRVSLPVSGRADRHEAPQGAAQLTLTHPHAPRSAACGSNRGGCVMKMAVSSAPSPTLDAELTEEERMAKKREYWRIKKREQRAARAVRLKQGVLHALQRRKTHNKHVALGSRRLGSPPPVCSTHQIKQESPSDLHPPPQHAICPHIKPPPSPSPPPAPQPEPDATLSAESQATTLLAVASMKKLLEESLSTVAESESEQPDFRIETKEETVEEEIKPHFPQLFFEKGGAAPLAADLTLQIKSWQADPDALSPRLKDSPAEAALRPTCEHSSQTTLNFIVNPAAGPASPCRTQRSQTKKCCPEPPKLHHPPLHQLQPRPAVGQNPRSTSLSSVRFCSLVTVQCGLSSLQRKREYWKLMKRQQRARLKAGHREEHGECSSWSTSTSSQARGHKVVSPPALQLKPPSFSSSASPDAVSLPITSCVSAPPSEGGSHCLIPERKQEAAAGSQKWPSSSPDVDSAPSPPALKPPENPLSSINLQPIEPPGQTPGSTQGPLAACGARLHSPTRLVPPPTQTTTVSAMVPPKPVPGESEEDFLRRKREYWRVKKKEQRARKAIRERGVSARRGSNSWRPILPAEASQSQDSVQWEESDHGMSTSADPDPGSQPCHDYMAPLEDESDVLFDYDDNNNNNNDDDDDDEGPASDAVWRTRYLMDYDQLHQLLVCMVCGDLQYSQSLEGVRAHIDEAHPETLSLEPGERQRILEAWDEQVWQRERFFTSQLQQHDVVSDDRS